MMKNKKDTGLSDLVLAKFVQTVFALEQRVEQLEKQVLKLDADKARDIDVWKVQEKVRFIEETFFQVLLKGEGNGT